MKIAFVLPSFSLSGGVKVALEHAAYLQSRGHEVTCVFPRPSGPSIRQRAVALLRGQRPPGADTAPVTHWAGAASILTGRRPGILTRHDIPRADIIVSTWWETAEWCDGLPSDWGQHVHFVQGHEIFPFLLLERVRGVYRLPVPKIVVSRWLLGVLTELYGATAVHLVENGVDADRFWARDAGDRPFDVGFIWSNTPGKNSKLAGEVIEIVRRQKGSISVVIFGNDIPPAEILSADGVVFHHQPNQEMIPDLYNMAKFWLFTSDEEGFGLPLLEACASGTPVISTSAGAAPEIIDGDNGQIVESSAEAMASALVAGLALPDDERARLSANARRTAERFSQQRSLEMFEAIICEIAGVTPAGR